MLILALHRDKCRLLALHLSLPALQQGSINCAKMLRLLALVGLAKPLQTALRGPLPNFSVQPEHHPALKFKLTLLPVIFWFNGYLTHRSSWTKNTFSCLTWELFGRKGPATATDFNSAASKLDTASCTYLGSQAQHCCVRMRCVISAKGQHQYSA